MRRLLVSVLLGLTLAGCGWPSGPVSPAPAGGSALWQDAAIFVEAERMVAEARAEVLVEMYEFDREDMALALAAAHRRGLSVRLIVDPTVPESLRTASHLAAGGIEVRSYPVDDRRHQIDHVKLLWTEAAALVGGMNWGRRSHLNHDYALEARSAAERERLRAVFEQDWGLAGGRPAPLAAGPGPVAQTAPGEEVRALLDGALAQVRVRVWAEVFVLTDSDLIAHLVAAHRSGAQVRMLLDPGQAYNRDAFRRLRSAGVEVRWYRPAPGAKLHAKAGLFDGRLVLGSANWSLSGLSINHELDLETDEDAAVAAFAARFAIDWSAA